jgi:hypothetical protein
VAVHFDVPAEECKARVASRTDHPTIPFGRGAKVVESFASRMQPPTVAEGFERVHVVRSFEEAALLLRSLIWGWLRLGARCDVWWRSAMPEHQASRSWRARASLIELTAARAGPDRARVMCGGLEGGARAEEK